MNFGRFAWLTAGLALSGCCFGGPETEGMLPVPSSVEEARALQASAGTTVTVARESRPAGGGACGHSPVCLLVLPAMLWESVFPPEVDVIDILEPSGARIHGEWEPDGDLLWAHRIEGGQARAARLLDLPILGRRLVIEAARGPVGANGEPGELTPTTVQSQLDLLGDYQGALTFRSGGHAALLKEAVGALGAEGGPLLTEWLARPDESESRAALLPALCAADDAASAPLRLAALEASAPVAEPEIAAAAARCALDTEGSTSAPIYVARLMAAICSSASSPRALDLRELSTHPGAIDLMAQPLAACASPTRQALLARAVGLHVSAAEVREAIDTDPEAATALIDFLEPSVATDRDALFAHLRVADPIGPTVDRLMSMAELAPTGPEAELLVHAYLRYEPSLLRRRDPQGRVLNLLLRTTDPAPALARLAAAPEPGLEVHAARLVLGDRSRGPAVAERLLSDECVSGNMLVGESDLASLALQLAGCTCDDLAAHVRGKPVSAGCPAQ